MNGGGSGNSGGYWDAATGESGWIIDGVKYPGAHMRQIQQAGSQDEKLDRIIALLERIEALLTKHPE